MIHWYVQIGKMAQAEFDYVNYKGEKSRRQVTIHEIGFGSNEWHTEPQWMMRALDLEKFEFREFAMKDMTNFKGIA